MSMGVFMPLPAPLLGGGGDVLDGLITVGNYFDFVYGWFDGSEGDIPAMGSLTGDAAPYFISYFFWIPGSGEGGAVMAGNYGGAVLSFQGEDYIGAYDSDTGVTVFTFGPEVSTWPTSGTHPFTLTLP